MLDGTSFAPGTKRASSSTASVAVALRPPDADAKAPGQSSGQGEGNPDATALEKIHAEEEQEAFEQAQAALLQAIEESPELKELSDNIPVDMTPEGLRIQIVDRTGGSMFASGSAQMAGRTQQLIKQIAKAISKLPNKISVTGHTDATPFQTQSGYGNWELPSDRANASRRALVGGGIAPKRIIRVSGKADTEPLVLEDPFVAQNRRISVVLIRDAPVLPPPSRRRNAGVRARPFPSHRGPFALAVTLPFGYAGAAMTSTVKPRVGRFYKTPPAPCPYLPGREERKVFTELETCAPNAEAIHDLLTTAGFRRSHNILYRPSCDGCSACVPVRIDALAFRQSRNMRAVWRRNAGVEASVEPAIAAPEHYRLFRRYQEMRHGEGDMARMSFAEYRAMIEDSPLDTFLVAYRTPGGQLTGVCLTDRVSGGLSMVYSFFDPRDSRTSPGTYMILWHLETARREGLGHLYLGYWIAESQKMAYKSRFAAIEALGPDGWRAMPTSILAR